ncbi:MAG: hypothetical protein Q8N01_00640 [Sulfuricurvum sp.]|nr:hypothetical protein [Sulfuricurvum sp.]
MSRIFYIEINTNKRDELADLLKTHHADVLNKWLQNLRVQSVLKRNGINPIFFIKHFGSRVLDYFIGVLRREKEPGQCPVVMVMLKFFSERCILLDDIYQICSGMKNSVVSILLDNGIVHSDVKFATAVELFDANFSGVIREYNKTMHGEDYTKHCNISNAIPIVENQAILPIDNTLLGEYFAADEDDGEEKILFRTDDADDLLEYVSEVSERLSLAVIHLDKNEVIRIANIFSHASSILLHYSPFLDTLAGSMSELSTALLDHTEEFMETLECCEEGILRLFDAVSSDMDRYIQRFSVESMVMKNSHHIHEPTTLSIRQIITMFAPDQIDAGEIEFF